MCDSYIQVSLKAKIYFHIFIYINIFKRSLNNLYVCTTMDFFKVSFSLIKLKWTQWPVLDIQTYEN